MSTFPSARAAAVPRPERTAEPFTLAWLGDFLARELQPFPGRASTVARMTAAATIVALIIMVFRVPNAALGAYFALLITREDLRSTTQGALLNIAAFGVGTVYALVGMELFAGSPAGRFLWVIGSFYLIFFLIRTVRNYGVASGFSFLIASVIPLWDGPAPVEAKVHATLWTAYGVAIGSSVTLFVEGVYRSFHPQDSVVGGLVERLRSVEAVLRAYAGGYAPDDRARGKLLQYAMVGPASLRRSVVRSGEGAHVRARVAALISLTGRLLDMLAGLERARTPNKEHPRLPPRQVRSPAMQRLPVSESDAQRLLAMADAVRELADALGKLPRIEASVQLRLPPWFGPETPSPDRPLLPTLEGTVAMLRAIFTPLTNEQRDQTLLSLLAAPAKVSFFLPDAWTNRDHQLFALRGCVAASLCYIFYNAVDWPGINTSVATCIITALGTVGSSRQKQILRMGGAIAGGFLIALPAQVFLLPLMDSITSFLLFFAAVTALAAWFSTSSPRLSYFGLQIALAFDLVNLGEFQFQTSLSVARDRVVGVLTGLIAMWVAFDQFGAPRASEAMLRILAGLLDDLEALALAVGRVDLGVGEERKEALLAVWRLRERINASFSSMNEQADALQFETGFRRRRNLAAFEKMAAMQPAMRTVFLLEITIGQFRSSLAEGSAADREQFRIFQKETAQVLARGAQRVRVFAQGGRPPALQQEPLGELQAALGELQKRGATAGVTVCREIARALELLVVAQEGIAEADRGTELAPKAEAYGPAV